MIGGDDGFKMGNPRVSHVNPLVPKETFVLSERLRELADRIDRGELGEVTSGVALLMRGRVLVTVPFDLGNTELRDIAAALISAIDAQREIYR